MLINPRQILLPSFLDFSEVSGVGVHSKRFPARVTQRVLLGTADFGYTSKRRAKRDAMMAFSAKSQPVFRAPFETKTGSFLNPPNVCDPSDMQAAPVTKIMAGGGKKNFFHAAPSQH